MAITYRQAGVDTEAGDELVDRISAMTAGVRLPGVLAGIGGFAGLFEVPTGFRRPVLVSGTDGVGTKLELAYAMGAHDTVGIDLVAMCVNDIITLGARPLFFLDYFASSKLNVVEAEQVIRGIVNGCELAGCALLGGETAEMPGLYPPSKYDLAGFAVGIVERDEILCAENCHLGDVVVGVASSGLHSNGYSLARAVVEKVLGNDWAATVDGLDKPIGQVLLTPTKIYAKSLLSVLGAMPRGSIRSVCHVTGGGIEGNLPRVLPRGLLASIDLTTYDRPPIFQWIQQAGPVEEAEMRRTFNLGVGLCVVVDPSHANALCALLANEGEHAWVLGQLVGAAAGQSPEVCFRS